MKLTLKIKLTLDEVTFNALREISEYSGKFYNMVNYDFRNGNFMSFYDMYDDYKNIPMLIKLVRDKGYQEYPIRLKVV